MATCNTNNLTIAPSHVGTWAKDHANRSKPGAAVYMRFAMATPHLSAINLMHITARSTQKITLGNACTSLHSQNARGKYTAIRTQWVQIASLDFRKKITTRHHSSAQHALPQRLHARRHAMRTVPCAYALCSHALITCHISCKNETGPQQTRCAPHAESARTSY